MSWIPSASSQNKPYTKTTMNRALKIKYYWKPNDGSKEIPKEHIEELEESAMARILEMIPEDYTSGELHANIRMSDETPDGTEYSGWWDLTREDDTE